MPIGCAAIGKVLYRTSDLIVDDLTSGGERFGRELATSIVDPMRGITRIVTGCAWKNRNTSSRCFGIPPISIELSLWARLPTFHNCCRTTKKGGVGIIYRIWRQLRGIINNPLLLFFVFDGAANDEDTTRARPHGNYGPPFSHEIIEHKDYNVSVVLYQHFYFFDSDTIKVQKISRPHPPVRRALQNGHPGIYRHRNYVSFIYGTQLGSRW